MAGERIVHVSKYGAVGDGKTDNYTALQLAVQDIRNSGIPTILEFDKNSEYLVDSIPLNRPAIFLFEMKKFTLRGNNTTISVTKARTYVDIQYCENVTVDGFNFKYTTPIYTLSKVLSINHEQPNIIIQSRHSLGIQHTWYDNGGQNFGLPYLLNYGRRHIFYDRVDIIDANENIYKLNIRNVDRHEEKLDFMEATRCDFLTPIPDVGQVDIGAFLTTHTTNLTLMNCNMWAASHFAFHMRYNYGVFHIKNVHMVPEPGTGSVMVGWRDGFHVKENRAKFIWEDCMFGGIFDDIWNSSCTVLTVREVFSPTEFEMGCMEFGGYYPMPLERGDILELYDTVSGAFVGRTSIKRIIRQNAAGNHIEVQDPLPLNRPSHVQVVVESLSNPQSEIHRCRMTGTFRLRGSMSIYDSDFFITYSWIENQPPMEGPIPKNIHFKRCRLRGLNSEAKFMTLGSTASYTQPVQPEYHTQNITFEDCDINPNQIFIRSPQEDVRFLKQGSVYYTASGPVQDHRND